MVLQTKYFFVDTSRSQSIPYGTKFLRVLIFAIFPAIGKNKFPQIKITANIFPKKIYSRVNIFSNLNLLHRNIAY